MKHIIKCGTAFLIALTLIFQFSCANTDSGENAGNSAETSISGETVYPYTFTDSTGASITIEKQPETVAILFSSLADIWKTAGGETEITVGESVVRGFADSSAVLVDSGSGHTAIDLETLVASEPDLVIGTADYEGQVSTVGFCNSVRIPSALFRVDSFDDYLGVLKIFCELTGNIENYTRYGTDVKARIDKMLTEAAEYVKAESAAKPILFIRAGTSDKSTKAKNSSDNFACAMLKELGTENIADGDSELVGSLSLETVLEADPDYLFITTMGDETAATEHMNSMLAGNGWKELSCVKTGQYYYLPKDLFHYKPNSRWDEAYKYLISILYPGVDLSEGNFE